MKKHAVTIINLLLVIAIVCGIAFVILYAPKNNPDTNIATKGEATYDEVSSDDAMYTIGVVQHSNNEECNACYTGFINELSELGFTDGKNIKIEYILEENEENCRKAIDELIAKKCDLLYTIGPFASIEAAKKTSTIPIIFSAVSDPEKEGLVNSNEVPGKNVTGVSSYTPCFEQIDSIVLMFPKAEKVGAIYNGTDENAVIQTLVAQGEANSDEIGLSFDTYPVILQSEISDKLNSIKDDKIDVIYIPIDDMMYENLDAVVEFSNENKIPIICGNEKMLQKGCFSTCIINYNSIGRKSADMTLDILTRDKKPEQTPVIYKYDCDLLVNKDSMDKLGIKLRDEIKSDYILKTY